MYKPHTWVEINFDNMGKNIDIIRKKITDKHKIMPVIKADSYGFGAVEVARFLETQGIPMVAVSLLTEGIELRRAGVSIPILIFNYIPQANYDLIFHYNLTPTVYSPVVAKALNQTAVNWNKEIAVHLNLDTGLSRVGALSNEIDDLIESLKECSNLQVAGVYSHFALADSNDTAYTLEQYRTFNEGVQKIKAAGFEVMTHAANSAAFLRGIAVDCDYIRVGASVHGFSPDEQMLNLWLDEPMKPVISMKSIVGHIKTLPKGVCVSYGCTYTTSKETVVATIPVGYGDGLRRVWKQPPSVLVKGQRAPIIGRVCMDQCMIDITHIEGVKLEDEVVLCGTQGSDEIAVSEIAEWMGVLNYEFPTFIHRRVPRYYYKNNKLLASRGHVENL